MVYGAHQRMDISKCTDTHLVNDLLQGKPFMSCSIVNCNSEVCTRVHSPYSSKYVSQVCCTAHSTIHAPLSLYLCHRNRSIVFHFCACFFCFLLRLQQLFSGFRIFDDVFRFPIKNLPHSYSWANFSTYPRWPIYARNIFRVCNFKYFELTRAKTKLVN